VPGALVFTSEVPVAFGGFCDAYKGTLDAGVDICIKKIRICASDNADKVKQAGRQFNLWFDPR